MILFGAYFGAHYFQCVAVDEAEACTRLRQQYEASGLGMCFAPRPFKLGVTQSAPGNRTITRHVRKERSRRKRKAPGGLPFVSFDNLPREAWS